MLDLRLIRKDPDRVRAALARRGDGAELDRVLLLDASCRALRTEVEEMRAESTRIAMTIGQAKRAGESVPPATEAIARGVREQTTTKEDLLRAAEADRDHVLLGLPNLAHPDAPDGGEDDAVEVRTVGAIPAFDYEPLDHVTIAEALGGLDLERAARTSGARFAYLLGPLVRLQLSLVTYAVDLLEHEGFMPVIPPVLVREEALVGTGFFPTDRSAIYQTADDDLFLVGTSEVPLAAFHQDEILREEDLPLRYAGISTCFRREAGAAGRDNRGIFRVHQFDKVEMFSFVAPEDAKEEHLRLLAIEEQILTTLGLPYRVLDIAVDDLGASAARKFDCEAWLPSEGRYRELTSTSNTSDFQARRLAIRMRREGGKPELLATLNGTAVAVGRTIIALLENGQQADRSVVIPQCLVDCGAAPVIPAAGA